MGGRGGKEDKRRQGKQKWYKEKDRERMGVRKKKRRGGRREVTE